MGMHEEDYGTDDEWRAADSVSSLGLASTKRQTRSSSKSRKAKKKDEVIEILDSSSEEESSEDEAMSPVGKQSKVSSCYITEQQSLFCHMQICLIVFVSFLSPA